MNSAHVRMMVSGCIEEMFKKGIAKYRDDPPFTLTSGKKSPWYFDIKSALFDPSVLQNIHYYLNYLYHSGGIAEFDKLGGIANGGYSMVTLAMNCDLASEQAQGFVYRKKPKGHGLQNLVDGYNVKNGENVFLLEDVITTGGSLVPVIKYVQESGGSVSQIFCVVDRIEEPHPDFAQYMGNVISMVTLERAKKVFDKMESEK